MGARTPCLQTKTPLHAHAQAHTHKPIQHKTGVLLTINPIVTANRHVNAPQSHACDIVRKHFQCSNAIGSLLVARPATDVQIREPVVRTSEVTVRKILSVLVLEQKTVGPRRRPDEV